MKLPPLHNPQKYAGLYVFDFGQHASIGYTAEEILILLESARFPDGRAYRIYRALPDGTLELQPVGRESLVGEDGLLFYRHQVRDARRDFHQLVQLAEHESPPCRLSVELAKIHTAGPAYLLALIYPVAGSGLVSDWLNRIKFEGGDFVRGGAAEMACYQGARPMVIESRQWSGPGLSRPAEQVLATIDLAVQR